MQNKVSISFGWNTVRSFAAMLQKQLPQTTRVFHPTLDEKLVKQKEVSFAQENGHCRENGRRKKQRISTTHKEIGGTSCFLVFCSYIHPVIHFVARYLGYPPSSLSLSLFFWGGGGGAPFLNQNNG
jgi:hypothetical protein